MLVIEAGERLGIEQSRTIQLVKLVAEGQERVCAVSGRPHPDSSTCALCRAGVLGDVYTSSVDPQVS